MSYGRHLKFIEGSELEYDEHIKPEIIKTRLQLKLLYQACYNIHPDIAWAANPQFVRVQKEIDRLEKELHAVFHPDETPTPRRK